VVRRLVKPFSISFSFIVALLLAASCGRNFADITVTGDCNSAFCAPGYDAPGQVDDGSYHEGEDPDHHSSSGGSTTGDGGSSTSSDMEPAPMRFGYQQKEVDMDGGPEF